MRRIVRALCAVALAACSEPNAPTVAPTTVPHGTTGDSLVVPPTPTPPVDTVAARTVAQRLEDGLAVGLTKVVIPPDGFSLSADAVHPDMACPPEPWNAAKCWLMYTPYLNSDNAYENPAFLFAANDTSWSTPTGVLNPIIPYPGIRKYNSDPDHAFDPGTHRLVQVYRVVADSFNSIMIMSTGDAKQWTTPSLAFKERNHDAVSPALVIDQSRRARLWYVRSGEDGCQSKTTTVQLRTAQPDSNNSFDHATWSDPTPVNIALPNAVVWHLDVTPVPGGYVALIAAYPKGGSCSFSDLWIATSSDGVNWRNYAVPILWRTMKFAARRNMATWYRGTLRYDAATDSLHLWPSALVSSSWTVFHTGMRMSDLMPLLESAQPADLSAMKVVAPAHRASLRAIEMP